MISAADLLVHLEGKFEAALQSAGEDLPERLVEIARFVREIAEAALVAGDEVTLREARRVAARLDPLAFPGGDSRSIVGVSRGVSSALYSCPRCGQRFRGPTGPLEQVGSPLCEACAHELLAGIRL